VDTAAASAANPIAIVTGSRKSRASAATAARVYIIVRNGLPPVMAAAANADSAVGGLTSDSTA
jgi:hypothetical protein